MPELHADDTELPTVASSSMSFSATSRPNYAEAEYKSLRDEIVKRIEFRHQLIQQSVIATGALLAASSQFEAFRQFLLVFPVLLLFIATGWARHGVGIMQLERHLRMYHENRFAWPGWNSDNEGDPELAKIFRRLGLASSTGLFCAMGILSMLVGFFTIEEWQTADYIMLWIGVFAILNTLLVAVLYYSLRGRHKLDPDRSVKP